MGSTFKPSYIWNCLIIKNLIKKFQCINIKIQRRQAEKKYNTNICKINHISRYEDLNYASYHINPKYWDRQAWADSVDPDQMLKNKASSQDLYCLQFIQQFLDISMHSKTDSIKF